MKTNSDHLLLAERHAFNCKVLIESQGLSAALTYCSKQRIDPPQCSLTAKSENADKLRLLAANMLSDEAWWKKRLKRLGNQDFESLQIKSGKVTNIVSDVSLESYLKKKK